MDNTSADKPALLSLDKEEWLKIKLVVVDRRACAQRMSIGFIVDFIRINEHAGEKYHILREIDFLEGLRQRSNTKEKQFRKNSPLYPFWHKHWFAPRHLVRNVGARWALDRGGNRDLDRMINGVATTYGSDPDQWPGILAYKFWIDGFMDRTRDQKNRLGRLRDHDEHGLTGDWIIFAKHEGQNYYLGLATHEEGRRSECLYERLHRGSSAEFPFLFAR